ncbi:MAG TPA: cytochrome P450 [Amycolatopsis sp.]|uniref:cytochrome P450 n=1 Tax=Amycolatopsis sp. TaxID=37632 RepID=UPI002B45EB7F|nr:cytochrome P450 [Amycolatopsis sp.]HJQ48780.1 cytochrome P450 [Amycolatopsis sp.]HKS50218.1 cytochrome P450 [Amycolatopsis sp.]
MTTGARTVSGVPELDVDPYDHDVLREPHEFHEQLRQAGPLVWLPRYEVYACGRYDQVHAGLRQWQELISSAGVGLPDLRDGKYWRTPSLLIETDPPAHTPRRKVVNKVLSARALRNLREDFTAAADRMIDGLLERGTFDAVAELAEAFPLTVFPAAVGLGEQVRPHLLTYGDLVFNGDGPENDLFTTAMAKAPEAIAEQTRRERLRPGGLGARIWEAVDRGEPPEDDAPLLVRSLLTAGVDTTVASIAAAIYCLATNPDQWRLLRKDPARARVAFEEAIRFESPVQTFYRTAVRGADIAGVRVPAEAKVLLHLASANRDHRRFERPHRYDLTRRVLGHVGFGMGIHHCVGQHLARMEGEVLLSALAAKVATLELAGTPTRRLNNTLRSWGRLPVSLTPA